MVLRIAALALLLGAGSVLAQTAAPTPDAGASDATTQASVPHDILAIHEALHLPEVIAIMAEEGIADGVGMAESLFPSGQVPQQWTDMVESIYRTPEMEAQILADLTESLQGEDLAAIRTFVESAAGQQMAELETAARRAMIDEEVEQAAKEAAAVALADDSPRLALLRRYAEANDLVEANVAGAMNSNYAYFMGLLDGGAMQREMTESDVLSDIWSQEPQIRSDTVEWVYSFLLKAYEPASDADLEAMIAFSESDPGRALNRALFAAFDARFVEISRALGLAAARYMTTSEL